MLPVPANARFAPVNVSVNVSARGVLASVRVAPTSAKVTKKRRI
jgi:hypothetical protein